MREQITRTQTGRIHSPKYQIEKTQTDQRVSEQAIRAVIFDLDGTLIDTEKYYRVYWPKALAAFGYTMTDEQALTLRSLGRPFAPRQLKEWFGEALDYEAVRSKRKELMQECLDKEGISVKPGAVSLLEYLREHEILRAIATATDLERTGKYLAMTGLAPYFDKLISATQVAEGKPSPDIYRYACEQLGLKPGQCIAVEDAPNGVLSAYRAGCRVIMVPDQTQPDEKLQGYLWGCVDDLSQIIKILDGGGSCNLCPGVL